MSQDRVFLNPGFGIGILKFFNFLKIKKIFLAGIEIFKFFKIFLFFRDFRSFRGSGSGFSKIPGFGIEIFENPGGSGSGFLKFSNFFKIFEVRGRGSRFGVEVWDRGSKFGIDVGDREFYNPGVRDRDF